MIDLKLIGCIFLITGTSIGAGMLALPVITAQLGFSVAVLLLLACWGVMTTGAFLMLEANLWLPKNSHIISMARATIGPIGQIIAWATYLLLLYSLLCAYIAGGSDLLQNLLSKGNIHLQHWLSACLFTLLFGAIVYLGIRAVDYTNRLLLSIKLGAYLILSLLLLPYLSIDKLMYVDFPKITLSGAITITIVSFGYATIIPSLRVYFAGQVHKIKLAILIGSLVPLCCYILWDAVIMGIIPLQGPNGLMGILASKNSTSDLVNTLIYLVHRPDLILLIKVFTSICVLTSFLGTALCLADFLADGLSMEREGLGKMFTHLITFFPPLLIAVFFPGAFIVALEYGGIYCLVLLVLLPAWMVWAGRYKKHINHGFKVGGGKGVLILMISTALILITWGICNSF